MIEIKKKIEERLSKCFHFFCHNINILKIYFFIFFSFSFFYGQEPGDGINPSFPGKTITKGGKSVVDVSNFLDGPTDNTKISPLIKQNTNTNVNRGNPVDMEKSTESIVVPSMEILKDDPLPGEKDLVIDDFENLVQWMPYISRDYGFMNLKYSELKRNLFPQMKKENNNQLGVLGIKVSYFKKGFYKAFLRPPSPIKIPGITRKFSIWVRTLKNNKHRLYLTFKDGLGKRYKLYFKADNRKISKSNLVANGEYLSTSGLINASFEWRKYSVTIKESTWEKELAAKGYYTGTAPIQTANKGLTFEGIVLESNLESSSGDYYFFLDQFTVRTYKTPVKEQDGLSTDW